MLYSVLEQSYSEWECVVIDDGNNIETKIAVSELNDNRIKYFIRPIDFKKGLSGSRNYGLALASGKYYQFIDDDDILHPLFLKTKMDIIDQNEDLDYIISPLKNFSGSVPTLSLKISEVNFYSVDWKQYVLGNTGIFSCSVLWKNSCFESNNFNENLIVSEDYDLYWRLFKEYKNGMFLNVPHYFRRVHQKSNSENLRSNSMDYKSDFIKSRVSALEELIRINETDRHLGLYFLFLGIKNRNKQLIELVNSANFDFSLSDRCKILKYQFSKRFKSLTN